MSQQGYVSYQEATSDRSHNGRAESSVSVYYADWLSCVNLLSVLVGFTRGLQGHHVILVRQYGQPKIINDDVM